MNKLIKLIRAEDGRWRVFFGEEDINYSFQFPWDALQCALNGSLTGTPISDLHTIRMECSSEPDLESIKKILETEEKQRKLVESLKGIDGEGI